MTNKDNHSPIKILYVTQNSGLNGGATIALLNLMLDMKERYNVIPSMLVPDDEDLAQRCRQNGIEVFCMKFYSWVCGDTLFSKLKGLIKTILNRIYFHPRILRALRGRKFDIIHTNSSVTDMGSVIARKFNVRHVWHIRECLSRHYDLLYCYPLKYVRYRYSLADSVAAISHSVQEYFNSEFNLPEKTRIIYDGMRVPEAYEKRRPLERINFCMTGLVSEGKNQLMAVKAFSFLKEYAGKFTLHIIGDITSKNPRKYADELQNLADSFGLGDNIKFWGFRRDVDKILHDMDVGLMLSRCEGFGRVTVEYMLNYMPVIGVDTGATPEIVADGETGFICGLDDSEKLAELMIRFIENPELIASMGRAGRERAVKNFSLEQNTDSIYSLYQEILSR